MHGIDADLIYSYLGDGWYTDPLPSKLDNWETFESCEGEKCIKEGAVENVIEEVVIEGVVDAGNGTQGNVTLSEECQKAIDELENESSDVLKLALKVACEDACKDDETAECGYLVNGMSMILFALLAALKY